MSLEQAPEYKEIAEKIIDKYQIAFSHINLDEVLFLKETSKMPKKYADIKTVRAPYTFMTDYKFIITFYEAVMSSLNEAQTIMVVYHELLHIDYDFHKLRSHNVEDFIELVSKFGASWNIDPNLPNILEDEDAPVQNDNSTPQDLDEDEDEPSIL